MPFSGNSPTALDVPFAQFIPAALKIFRHPGRDTHFFRDTREGTVVRQQIKNSLEFR